MLKMLALPNIIGLCFLCVLTDAVPYKKHTGYKVFKHKPKIIYDSHDQHEYEEKYHDVDLQKHYGYGTKVIRTTVDEHDYHDNHAHDYQDLQIAYGLHDPHKGEHNLDFLHHHDKKYQIVNNYRGAKKSRKSYDDDDCHDYHDDFFGLHEHQGAKCSDHGYGYSKSHGDDFHDYFEHNSGYEDHPDGYHDSYDKHDGYGYEQPSYGYEKQESYDKHDGYGYEQPSYGYEKQESYDKHDGYGYEKHDSYEKPKSYGYKKPKHYEFEEHDKGGHGHYDDHQVYKPKIVVIKKIVPLTTTTTPFVEM
ncbi:hypothetical protein CAPTEDRAFT_212610 [Capitella teleta]|uniref:Uncharacterized protein n=1 Tax=Capitella teleta TaxID=283909 RepID=R7U1A1_CAPTE|nr:hypothetical protein CAPTEDRAFT_212610 [Capitella teleta]|eukprot:ELT99988.1 hypothetical protein CAPTEDRAFT_212610 [Capitella teleta]